MSKVRLPDYTDLMYPTLEVIDKFGGSATIRQLEEEVHRRAGVTDRQMAVVYRGKSKVLYLMRWACTYLKKVGAVENPTRGVWSLTPEGERYLRMDRFDADRKLRQKDN